MLAFAALAAGCAELTNSASPDASPGADASPKVEAPPDAEAPPADAEPRRPSADASRDVAADRAGDAATAWPPCVLDSPNCYAIRIAAATLARDRDDFVLSAVIESRRVSYDRLRVEALDAWGAVAAEANLWINSSVPSTLRFYLPGAGASARARLTISGNGQLVGSRVSGSTEVAITELPVVGAGAPCDGARLRDTCPDGSWCGLVDEFGAAACLPEAAPTIEGLTVRTDPARAAVFATWRIGRPPLQYGYVLRALDAPASEERVLGYSPDGVYTTAGWSVPVGARVGVRARFYVPATLPERRRLVEGPEAVVTAGGPEEAPAGASCDRVNQVVRCAREVPCLPLRNPGLAAACTPTALECPAGWAVDELAAAPGVVVAEAVASAGLRTSGCQATDAPARLYRFTAPTAGTWRFRARLSAPDVVNVQVRRWCSLWWDGATCGAPSGYRTMDSVVRVELRAGERVTVGVFGDHDARGLPGYVLDVAPL
ncbi:MAG: hypothetical protein U0324_43755 [Polyangiales bacterium]